MSSLEKRLFPDPAKPFQLYLRGLFSTIDSIFISMKMDKVIKQKYNIFKRAINPSNRVLQGWLLHDSHTQLSIAAKEQDTALGSWGGHQTACVTLHEKIVNNTVIISPYLCFI